MPTASTLTAVSAALTLGLAAYAQSATAQDVEGITVYGQTPAPQYTETVSVRVPFGDLDLSGEAGASVMLQRIHNAAETICGTESGHLLDRLMVYQPCVNGITNRAVDQFDDPLVAELNDRRMGAMYYVTSNGYYY